MKNEFSKAEWDAMKNFPKISLHLQKTAFCKPICNLLKIKRLSSLMNTVLILLLG